MATHFNDKHNLTPVQYECPICPFRTRRKGNLRSHYAAKHDPNPRACTLCPFNSKTKSQLRIHIQEKHPDSLQ
jgi:uncharacterized Zn-finger protein